MPGLQEKAIRPALATLLCVAASLSCPTIAHAGSARDYLNAPVDSWLTIYNSGYSTSVTPEDGTDITSRTRSNAFVQSVVITRTMDYGGRTGGLSIVLPYAFADTNSGSFQASTNGVSDVGFLWQMNMPIRAQRRADDRLLPPVSGAHGPASLKVRRGRGLRSRRGTRPGLRPEASIARGSRPPARGWWAGARQRCVRRSRRSPPSLSPRPAKGSLFAASRPSATTSRPWRIGANFRQGPVEHGHIAGVAGAERQRKVEVEAPAGALACFLGPAPEIGIVDPRIGMKRALSAAPCDKTSFHTLARCAPNAMRIAISPVRCSTAYEITP